MAEAGDAPKVGELFRGWIYRRLGVPGLIVLAVVGGLFFVWSQWQSVQTWPGVAATWDRLTRDAVPKADGDRFSVIVANIDGDASGENRRLLLRLIDEFDGVQVLRLDRIIPLKGADAEAAERAGHERARGYLRESGASILIWGELLTHAGVTKPRLYLTAAQGESGPGKQYAPTDAGEAFRLPDVFWEDLAKVLRLVVATRESESRARDGHYVADGLPPFIASVRLLLEESAGRPGWDADGRGAALFALANALRTLGEQSGQSASLEEAVATYRAALEERARERVPLVWASTQNNLGLALWRLGERDSGTGRLEEAVVAFRAASEEMTRERVPLDWATTQCNLGNALTELGDREAGTARLAEAVAVYRAALEENTRDRVPLKWATTQNNLGNALTSLGERERDTARLEEAVAAYRAALEEWTRERVPLHWAMSQDNLGNALTSLGELESGTARLEEAAARYRAALQERTRERVPLDWATTQSKLGHALWRLGERESGTARLEDAVAACRAALQERTRERVPLDWAATQTNLGNALATLGVRESGTARLEEAVAAHRAALDVFEAAGASHYAQLAHTNVSIVEMLLTLRRVAPASAAP